METAQEQRVINVVAVGTYAASAIVLLVVLKMNWTRGYVQILLVLNLALLVAWCLWPAAGRPLKSKA